MVNALQFFSNAHSFEVMKELFDHFSKLTNDGEGEVARPKNLDGFIAFFGNEEDFDDVEVNMLPAYTLHES